MRTSFPLTALSVTPNHLFFIFYFLFYFLSKSPVLAGKKQLLTTKTMKLCCSVGIHSQADRILLIPCQNSKMPIIHEAILYNNTFFLSFFISPPLDPERKQNTQILIRNL